MLNIALYLIAILKPAIDKRVIFKLHSVSGNEYSRIALDIAHKSPTRLSPPYPSDQQNTLSGSLSRLISVDCYSFTLGEPIGFLVRDILLRWPVGFPWL